ncbi:MAG: M13 family metallopeptidase N-terminal domain-containing protein, partial [Pseudomonadota bacterium]
MGTLKSEKAKQPTFGSWGVDLSFGDPNVAPGEDFFRYVNGKWMNEYELPADKVAFGAFHALADQSQDRVHALIEELVDGEAVSGTAEQKVRDFYVSFMDEACINARGLEPIESLLEEIRAIASVESLILIFARSSLDGFYSPISWNIGPDVKDPDCQILMVGVGPLSQPDRDFYLEDVEHFKNIRAAFVQNVQNLLAFAGFDTDQAKATAEHILALETQMAQAHWPRTEMRDADKTYNMYSFEALCQAYPDIDWAAFFNRALLPKISKLNVTMPSAVEGVIKVIHAAPLPVWRAYLAYKFLVSQSHLLSDEIAEAAFDFYGRALSGQQVRLPRWKRAVGLVSQHLGDAVGQLYVERHFPPEAKEQMDALVSNVMAAFSERIDTAPWMGEETRGMAKKKLATFLPKIGYPDTWKDYSSVRIEANDFYGNARRAERFAYQEKLDQLGKPT